MNVAAGAMENENPQLSPKSAGFALSAAFTVLFSTVLACVKDAYRPLLNWMNAIAWHNWITHGIADVILFFAMGLIFSKTGFAERMSPPRLVAVLAGTVIAAGAGLFLWYFLF